MATSKARRTLWILAGLLAAALSGLTAVRYRRDISGAIERVSTGSQIAETRCGPIEYAVAGEGPPVLVVHGAGGGYDQGLEFAEPLIRSGFRVIAMSRFGYLRSPLPSDGSPAAQADAYACLLDALNVTEVALAGVSAGGPSSMRFALNHPERITALVLVVPAAYAPRADEETPTDTARGPLLLLETAMKSDFLFWAFMRLAPGAATRTILGTPETVVENAPAAEQARVQRTLDHVLPVSLRRQGLLNDAAVVSSLPRFELEKITARTLVISAADCLYGTFDGSRYTAAHIPGARFVGYPSGGHLLVGHQQAVTSEIVAFLR
jgi:pimeloyl-ACP methyl ester carboxylesterase